MHSLGPATKGKKVKGSRGFKNLRKKDKKGHRGGEKEEKNLIKIATTIIKYVHLKRCYVINDVV